MRVPATCKGKCRHVCSPPAKQADTENACSLLASQSRQISQLQVQGKNKEKQLRKTSDINLWPPHSAHSYVHIHFHMHTHIHTHPPQIKWQAVKYLTHCIRKTNRFRRVMIAVLNKHENGGDKSIHVRPQCHHES